MGCWAPRASSPHDGCMSGPGRWGVGGAGEAAGGAGSSREAGSGTKLPPSPQGTCPRGTKVLPTI